jgi:hypothetical protein
LVSTFKRYLHKWPQNRLFLPAPPAKQVTFSQNHRHSAKSTPFFTINPSLNIFDLRIDLPTID